MIQAPEGYHAVEWADGEVHAFDMGAWEADPAGGPSWRYPVLCGTSGPGVSSDDYGHDAIRCGQTITCTGCIGILS